MKTFFPCMLSLVLTASLAYGQFQKNMLYANPESDAALDSSVAPNSPELDAGNEMDENPMGRAKYYATRHAFPNQFIPPGALRKAVVYSRTMPRYTPSGDRIMSVGSTWQEMGPINIGGRINAIAVNPLNGNTIYIGAADGGTWKSYDEGVTWVSVSDSLPTQSMGALVIDPLDTNVLYAGTGEGILGSDFISRDGNVQINRRRNDVECYRYDNFSPRLRRDFPCYQPPS